MDFASTFLLSLLATMLTFSSIIIVHGDSLVPAMIIFGDSSVDPGNNNKMLTTVKSNYPPYGRDFVTHKPTGRFSNGKLAIDFIAESLGFTSYQPAYLSQEANGENLLIGCNFASAGSGYIGLAAQAYGTISLNQQLHYYKEYQTKVVNLVGEAKANEILYHTIFIVNTGPTDFLTYFLAPHINKAIPLDQFINIAITSYANFIENLYAIGARKIGVTTVSAIGCLPVIITVFGGSSNQCIDFVNQAAVSFNIELKKTSETLKTKFPGLRLLVLDTYKPLLNIIQRPSFYGFSETRRGCCGVGLVEFSSLLCNKASVGTCANASQYVFWDAVHQTEAASKIIAHHLLQEGATLIP